MGPMPTVAPAPKVGIHSKGSVLGTNTPPGMPFPAPAESCIHASTQKSTVMPKRTFARPFSPIIQ